MATDAKKVPHSAVRASASKRAPDVSLRKLAEKDVAAFDIAARSGIERVMTMLKANHARIHEKPHSGKATFIESDVAKAHCPEAVQRYQESLKSGIDTLVQIGIAGQQASLNDVEALTGMMKAHVQARTEFMSDMREAAASHVKAAGRRKAR